MITFSKIGKKGNLGNQFFQIASTIGLALENQLDYGFLPWQYQSYFKNKLPSIVALPAAITILEEKHFHHHSWDFENKNDHYDLVGWLQTEKYFNVAKTKHYFEFDEALIQKIKNKYADAFQKQTILISIRRGDFVNHPDYLQLSVKFYFNALVRFFPDWQSRNLIVLSDDIDYCKFHFSFLDNAYFGDNLNAIEQLCLGSLCDDFIISNSTFSWWTAWLGEKENSKVIRPHQNFDGNKRLIADDKDYFPERWISYNAAADNIKLNDVTFYLNFKKNQAIVSAYLSHYFDVAIAFDVAKANETTRQYFFKKDYILPPLLLYYSILKQAETSSIIVNETAKIFQVSKKLNYEEFSVQQDFGMFSSIFNFNTATTKSKRQEIYVQSSAPTTATRLNINACVGQFSRTGYKFSFKRAMKKLEIMMKRNAKKILFIKK